MTWRNVTVEIERLRFITMALSSSVQMSFDELCLEFNISRKTGYKWFNRFLKYGEEGLKDRSRARLTHPESLMADLEKTIILIRKNYPTWGPKKIKALMEYQNIKAPSTGSIGNVLRKNALSKTRKYRRHVAQTAPLQECYGPNDVWMYDFKGCFNTENGQKCEPLTITDGYSRYLIKCAHMNRKRSKDVWEVLESAFLEYGLPKRIRSDNGPPFATTGVGRLSPLAIKLIKAGVCPEWIEPGCPQENGRHERFHLTLKNETATPAAKNLNLQILKMDQFRDYYNYTRPHEALGFSVPGAIFYPSERKWDGHLCTPEYDEEYEVRKVGKAGNITWRGGVYFLSETLQGENVGIKELCIGNMGVYFGPIKLGEIDLNKGFKRK